jgi:hypothetical protein
MGAYSEGVYQEYYHDDAPVERQQKRKLMQVTIKNVDVENVVNGRKRYSKATVDYTYNGEPRQQKIMSFANPDVFKKVQELVGQTVEVELTKNDAGYSEWKSINSASGAATTTANSPANTTRVTGSNYETKEERAARQVLIVKQSSLTAAVATLAPGAKDALDPDEVIGLAQQYVDWVFETKEEMPE